eukprot:6483597-Amphidinium_carterae.1
MRLDFSAGRGAFAARTWAWRNSWETFPRRLSVDSLGPSLRNHVTLLKFIQIESEKEKEGNSSAANLFLSK